MRIAITGATGFLGRALSRSLAADGHQVVPLMRKAVTEEAVTWDPESGAIETDALEGLDAVVHLAGESIASARWTADRKRRILRSRVKGTSVLASALAGLRQPPPVLISASAVGIYGDRGDEILTEASAIGRGFLAEVGTAWERAADPARQAGIRVVHPRFGIVLDPAGGALKQMLLPFRLGLGGPLGSGRQWVSWLTRRDAVRLIRFALDTATVAGPVNAAAPHPATFAEFARALGRALHRPAIFPVPAFALRLRFGEMADALLLASQRVQPAALTAAGFQFESPELEPALRALFSR